MEGEVEVLIVGDTDSETEGLELIAADGLIEGLTDGLMLELIDCILFIMS